MSRCKLAVGVRQRHRGLHPNKVKKHMMATASGRSKELEEKKQPEDLDEVEEEVVEVAKEEEELMEAEKDEEDKAQEQ